MGVIFVGKTKSVIDILRAKYPGKWAYDFRQKQWIHESGWYVDRRASLSPKYDGDDESYTIHYYRSDTGERLTFL